MAVIKCSDNGYISVICNKILRVYNLKESKLVHKHSFSDQSKTESSDVKNEEGQYLNVTFNCGCVFSKSGQFLAAFSDSKDVLVWRSTCGDWKLIGKRKVPKRPTAVLFTNKEDQVVICDKAGDVYSYAIDTGLPKETLVLGHVSMILDMVIAKDDRHIVTADRDEKIRVSCFPNAYNIETFCLGHKEYVWKIVLLETLPDILVSASGDGTVRFWNFKLGKTIHVETFEDTNLETVTRTVSCLACSKTKNIVFIGLKGSSSLYVYEVTSESEVKRLSTACIPLDAPPCCLALGHNDYLWVVQSHEEHTVVVFEMKVECGNYKFDRIPYSNISQLMSTEGWDELFDGLKQMPCLENLKRKEGPTGAPGYYSRKKDRIEAKRKKKEDTNCVLTTKRTKI